MPPLREKTLAQQKTDFTAEGAPAPAAPVLPLPEGTADKQPVDTPVTRKRAADEAQPFLEGTCAALSRLPPWVGIAMEKV
jgi:hypothetical protein